jgi:hypothetical protein
VDDQLQGQELDLEASNIVTYLDKIPSFAKATGDWIDYRAMLIDLAEGGWMVAPLYNVTRGNGGYMLGHYLVFTDPTLVTAHSSDLIAFLVSPEGRFPINGFVDHIAKKPGSLLRGNVVLSARLSIDTNNAWRSGNLVTSFG